MYIFKNVKVGMRTDETENMIFEVCDERISKIIDAMSENDCDEMMSTETGEVVTLSDLRRVRGILSGLPIIDIMYKHK